MEVESETSCNESETSCNDENDIAYDERYSDEEPELDPIIRKKLYPQCIIESDSNSDGENSVAIKQEPPSIDLTESCENGQFSNFNDGQSETSRNNATLDNGSNIYMLSNNTNLTERENLFRDNTMNNPKICPEMGADVSDMVQNLLQSRLPGNSPLQCSECDLECPSLSALEFHTKLHVMERIIQSSSKYPGIGLKTPSDKVNRQNGMQNEVLPPKSNALTNINAKTKSLNHQNSSKEKDEIHIDEARDIETIMQSLGSQEASEETSYSNSDAGYTGERPHKCDECGLRFTSTSDLKRHMRTHTVKKPYACTECNYRCARKDRLKIHMQTHDTRRKMYACMECDYCSGQKYKLKAHMKTHVSGHKQSDITKTEDAHIEKLTYNDTTTTEDIEIKKIKHAQERKFNCPECDYKCPSNSMLNLHMVKHSDKKPFKCIECDSRFKAKNNLKAHMQTHLSNKCFSCTHCEYTCPTKAQFSRHVLTHTGTKSHVCPLCDYKCNEKANLAKHMVVHGDDKPFSCPEEGCDYKCKLKCNLKTHLLRHSSEKSFACHLCDFRSSVKGDFTTHMFKHSGVKPFPCSVCGNCYAVKGDLKVHMRIHTNDKKFKCQLCDYRCFTQQRVNQHMLTHTGEKPHECDICGSRFTSTSNLKKHMRTHTGDKKIKSLRKSKFIARKPNVGSTSTDTTMGDHSEVSNASSQAHQTFHQGNTQPLSNQHILEATNIMGRSSQEPTHPDVNYKMYSNNMEYHSLSKRYSNFPPSAKPLWHQGSSSIPAVNTEGYNCQALSDMLLNTRKGNTHAGENLAHISQNYSHNPLAHYPRPMFINSTEVAHLNSKIPSTMPVPPNISDMIQHANDMYNIQ